MANNEKLNALIDLVKSGDSRIHPQIGISDLLRLTDGELSHIGDALLKGYKIYNFDESKDLWFDEKPDNYKVIIPTKIIWGVSDIELLTSFDVIRNGMVIGYKVCINLDNNSFEVDEDRSYEPFYTSDVVNILFFKYYPDAIKIAERLTKLYFGKD